MIEYSEVSVVNVENTGYGISTAILAIDDYLWVYTVYGDGGAGQTILNNSLFSVQLDELKEFKLNQALRLNYRNPKKTLDKFFKLLVIS